MQAVQFGFHNVLENRQFKEKRGKNVCGKCINDANKLGNS